jgi:TP901 family phage tail tape measure protein
MADRRVKVTFSAEIQNFVAAMKAASRATEETKKASEGAGLAQEQAGKKSVDAAKAAEAAAKKHKDAVENVGQVAGVAGAAVVAGVALAVKSYADFDKQMAAVDAATHETAGNMQLLRDAAVEAGADTAFSASEAAQGIEEMAKAGVSTRDILGGGLKGALSLAAAGSLGVGDAAEIAASAMTQFKLSGDKLPHVADLLAAGAGKAQGSVQDMGAALNQTGLIAAQTGLSIEETTGGLAAFASAGLTGSDAGTSFKTMLQRLTPQSLEAKNKMTELGISAYDAQGQFIGLAKFSENLKTSMKDLTPEARAAAMGVIFGSDAVRAANVLYENGSDGIRKWTDNVNDAGYAADTAARKQDNLAGDIEKLGGSFDSVLIQSGSGANDVLRGLTQGAERLVDTLGRVPGPVLGVGVGLAAVVGGAALLGAGLTVVRPKIAATREALELLAPAGSRAGAALSRTGKLAAGAASGLAAIAAASAIAQPALDNILKPTGETGDALEAFGGQAARGAVGADTLNKSFQDLVQHKDGVNDFQQALNGIADPGLLGNIDNIVVGGIKILSLGMADVTSTSDTARERMKALGDQLASVPADKAAASFQGMAKATDGSQEKLKQLLDLMPGYRAKLEEQAKAAGFATDDQTLLDMAMGKLGVSTEKYTDAAGKSVPMSEDLAKALEEIGVSADGSAVNLDKFTEAMFKATHNNLSARDAARGFQEAIDGVEESIKTNGTSLDINTEKGRANQAVLDKIANSGLAVVEANAKNGDSQKSLQGNLDETYQALVDGAGQFGITGTAAQDLARDVLNVPPGVDIKTWMSDEAKRMAEQTKAAVDGIPKHVNITIDTFKTTFEKVVGLPAQISDGSAGQGAGVYAPGFTPKKATGGRLAGYADGGQLPTSGPGTGMTDGFLGISSAGVPLARVDAGEWIINGRSSSTYNRELAAINAGTFPKLPGYANGGREYSAQSSAMRPSAPGTTINLNQHINGTTAPREVADEAMGMIRWELQKQGVSLGK